MPVTIRDVARAAGVSAMSVSKVLHGRGGNVRVSDEKATLIRQVAEDLKYRPNALARSFRRGKTQDIGLVFASFGRMSGGSQFFAQLFDGIASVAFPADYSVTVCPKLVNPDDGSSLGDGRFDGLIWCKLTSTTEALEAVSSCPVPIVIMHTPPPSSYTGVPFVSCNNEQGLSLAVEHLRSLGHQRIGYVDMDVNRFNEEAKARVRGFLAATADLGLTATSEDVLTWSSNCREFESYWGTRGHTGLICFSEVQAGWILKRAEQLAICIPEELSVIGFDSTEYCEMTRPRLSAISHPIEEMARKATELLIATIEGSSVEGKHFVYPCGFDVRDSTGKVPP